MKLSEDLTKEEFYNIKFVLNLFNGEIVRIHESLYWEKEDNYEG